MEAEILALPEEQIGRVTADVAQAAAIALGALPNLLKLRKDFEAFADADYFIKKLDRLQESAMAAFYAHVRAMAAGDVCRTSSRNLVLSPAFSFAQVTRRALPYAW